MPVTRSFLGNDDFQQYAQDRGASAPLPSDHVDARVLAAGTQERHAIPVNAGYVVFSSTAPFYAKFGNSTVVAAVPTVDVTDGTAAVLSPAARRIPETATHIALVAPADAVVTMEFYKL